MKARFRFPVVAAILLAMSACPAHAPDRNSNPVQFARSPFVPAPGERRALVFISDLHLGLGRKSATEWIPTEDFRWPKTLAGFLQKISDLGDHRVDLVILGDFLELWQPPDDVKCKGATRDTGCTISEMIQITSAVLRAHPEELISLRTFSQRGANRLHIVPGNHDSALLLEPIWQPLGFVLQADRGRINLVTSGVWTSFDGRVVAEHGHQIGSDVNRYDDWPKIIQAVGSTNYLIRSWGEYFVQRIFNEVERNEYYIIDNLSPESAGARYRLADRGLWKSLSDIAKFIKFNLFETSLTQKGSFLGPINPQPQKPEWDLNIGRSLEYRLFAQALLADDPFRKALMEDTEEGRLLRNELTKLAKDPNALPDSEVRLLCDLIAIRAAPEDPKCQDPHLGYFFESNFIPRDWVLQEHLSAYRKKDERIRIFIYGHTHQLEKEHEIKISGPVDLDISVLNTGAFHRVIDEEQYLRRIQNRYSPAEGLRRLTLEQDFPPCYTAVMVHYDGSVPRPVIKRWHMEETGVGIMVDIEDSRCH